MKNILVIGAGTYQVPIIKRCRELGYHVYCVDRNFNSPGFDEASDYAVIDVLNKIECLAYAKKNSIDAVLTYGATLTLSTVSYIGEKLGLPVLPSETAKISKSKYEIKKKLFEKGCNISGDFFEMKSIEDAQRQSFVFPCVIKPSDGSGSKGVSIVRNHSELDRAIQYAFESARYGSVYCESLISGEEYSIEAFVDCGNVYVYGIIKTTFYRTDDTNDSIEYGHRTPSGLKKEQEIIIENEIKKAVTALNITMGSVNFDVIMCEEDQKPYIIDCGIRVGQNLLASHIIPFSRGISIIDNTIKQALGERIDAEPKYTKCIASRLLIFNPGTIRTIYDMSKLRGTNGIVDIVLRKSIGDEQREYHEKSDTCGWVLCEGSTPEEAEIRASNARKTIKNYILIV